MWLIERQPKPAPRLSLDPTTSGDLQRLKQEVLADSAVTSYLTQVRSKRLALVLSGGGGKGAYEAGAVLALLDCGLRDFCAVAGTSVGALNAALCVDACLSGSRDRLLRTWCEISPWKVMHPTFSTVFALISTIVIRSTLLFLYISGSPRINDPDERPFTIESMTGGISAAVRGVVSRIPSTLMRTLRNQLSFFISLAAVFWYVTHLEGWLGHQPTFLEYWMPVMLLFLCVSLLVAARNWIGSRLSLMSNAPLRRTIAEVDIGHLRNSTVPIYCTLANVAKYWSPFHTDEISGQVVVREVWVPVYIPLSNANSDSEAVDWLLQSAALPEIFPVRSIRGLYFVDGAVVDNTPIIPVLRNDPDIIYSIYLKRAAYGIRVSKDLEEDRLFKIAEAMARADQLRDDTAAKEIQKKWISSRTWFGMKLQRNGAEPPFANPFPDRDPNNPTLLPQTTKHLRDITFVPIVPSEAIDRWPRLLTGVLNFSPKKARWLVGLGYRDMLVAIKSEANNQLRKS